MPLDVDRIAAFEAAATPAMAAAAACSSSSIGKDSDECSPPGNKEEEGEAEVQSAYGGGGGGGLVGLEALEEALPIRRSISKFYNGKSKSFACLKEAITSSGSAKDITKAENAYSRKRKNLLAFSIMYEKSHGTPGLPKRPASVSRNSLATLASSSSRSSSGISIAETELPEQLHSPRSPANCENSAPALIPALQPAPCEIKTSSVHMRSFSMMDLHRLHRPNSSVHLKDPKKMD